MSIEFSHKEFISDLGKNVALQRLWNEAQWVWLKSDRQVRKWRLREYTIISVWLVRGTGK